MLEIQPSSPTQSWTDLLAYSQEMFPDNALNSHRTLSTCGINFDYSNQKITDKTLGLLLDLADQCKVREKIHALMRGDRVNFSENKPALHTALRAACATPLLIDGQDIMPAIIAARKKMQQMVEKIRDHKWLGFSGQPIRDIVNIGIGGSDLAARLCLQALRELSSGELRYHFITDADPKTFDHTVKRLQPETTLFIVRQNHLPLKKHCTMQAKHLIGLVKIILNSILLQSQQIQIKQLVGACIIYYQYGIGLVVVILYSQQLT